jgi:Uma2 family endonuclease
MTAELTRDEFLSVEDYLAEEALSSVKHEYLGGVVYAMAGAVNLHNAIASNVLVALGAELRGKPCRPFNSDTKVRIQLPTHTRFYYPDAMIVCQLSPVEQQYQDAPAVLVEVCSESTRRTDEQEKKEAYLTIPSLRAYILLEQAQPLAVVWRRGDRGFTRERYDGLQAEIDLPEIGTRLRLADVYESVKFDKAKT